MQTQLINKPPTYIFYEVEDGGSEFSLSASRNRQPSMRVKCDVPNVSVYVSWTIENVPLTRLYAFRLEAQIMLEEYGKWPQHRESAVVLGNGCLIELTSAYSQPTLRFSAISHFREVSIEVTLENRDAIEKLHDALNAIIENWEEMYGTV